MPKPSGPMPNANARKRNSAGQMPKASERNWNSAGPTPNANGPTPPKPGCENWKPNCSGARRRPRTLSHLDRLRHGRRSGGNGILYFNAAADPAFPPLAAGVLLEAGGFEGGPGDQMGEGVEKQQVIFKSANTVNFVGDDGTFPALALDELAAGAVDDGGGVAFGAAADVDADRPAVYPAGAVVVSFAAGASFPGHRRFSKAAQPAGCSTHRFGRRPDVSADAGRDRRVRAAGRTPNEDWGMDLEMQMYGSAAGLSAGPTRRSNPAGLVDGAVQIVGQIPLGRVAAVEDAVDRLGVGGQQ